MTGLRVVCPCRLKLVSLIDVYDAPPRFRKGYFSPR